jgi:ubiquinone/menaquinone biosynthesis C-methylase UbiE
MGEPAHREAEFHDAWASSTQITEIQVRECFEAPTAMENQFIVSRMGDLKGKRLLDIGSGLGESSVYFALKGAQVTMADISPGMVETAKALAKLHGVEIEGLAVSAEDLQLPAESFDIIYIANTIHHVQDRELLFRKMHDVLRPGGWFFSYDPVAYNPVIKVYRRMATQVRSEDEAPLRRRELKVAKKYFPNTQHREFWMSTLLLFLKYYAIDRIHPNQERYWKKILGEKSEHLRWWMPLRTLDSMLTRMPGVRWLAWNMVMWGQKQVS